MFHWPTVLIGLICLLGTAWLALKYNSYIHRKLKVAEESELQEIKASNPAAWQLVELPESLDGATCDQWMRFHHLNCTFLGLYLAQLAQQAAGLEQIDPTITKMCSWYGMSDHEMGRYRAMLRGMVWSPFMLRPEEMENKFRVVG